MSDTTINGETREEIRAEPGAGEPPILFLHGIDRRYRQGDVTLEILRKAELAVWPGQSVALVAPSGAGKSTLLHVAGLLEQADAGEVYVDQAATSRLSDAERTRIRRSEIGFVYQFHHLLIEFSAIASSTGRPNCRAASSSGWRSRARSPTRRACCLRTSRPEISILTLLIMCSRH